MKEGTSVNTVKTRSIEDEANLEMDNKLKSINSELKVTQPPAKKQKTTTNSIIQSTPTVKVYFQIFYFYFPLFFTLFFAFIPVFRFMIF